MGEQLAEFPTILDSFLLVWPMSVALLRVGGWVAGGKQLSEYAEIVGLGNFWHHFLIEKTHLAGIEPSDLYFRNPLLYHLSKQHIGVIELILATYLTVA